MQGRKTNKKNDTPNTSLRKPYVRGTQHQYIYYRDVIHTEFKNGRLTNPLDPLYHLSYISGEKETHGSIDGNKQMSFSKYKYDEPFNLKVNDIAGTTAGSKNMISKYTEMNFMQISSEHKMECFRKELLRKGN